MYAEAGAYNLLLLRVCLDRMLIVFMCCSDVPPDAIASRSRFSVTLREDSRCFHTIHTLLGQEETNETKRRMVGYPQDLLCRLNASTYTLRFTIHDRTHTYISASVVLFISLFLFGWLTICSKYPLSCYSYALYTFLHPTTFPHLHLNLFICYIPPPYPQMPLL